jgi:hypothetical protein
LSQRKFNDSTIAEKINATLRDMNINDSSSIAFFKKQLEEDFKKCNSNTSGNPIKFGIYYDIDYYKK